MSTKSLGRMNSLYLIRFDDCCPTMNWPVWAEVERILLEFDVKPIMSVVPDNQDQALRVGQENENFWDEVRTWQARGWTIGLHGYQHVYSTQHPGLLGINRFSEFSGLPYAEQRLKLERALHIFNREQVTTDLWVAPGHSFDETTLNLLRDLGIRHLSAGHFLHPHLDSRGMMWIPQQLWRFRRLPFGFWTICLHINRWTREDVLRLRSDLYDFSASLTDFPSALARYHNRRRSTVDSLFSSAYHAVIKGRRWLSYRRASGFVPLC